MAGFSAAMPVPVRATLIFGLFVSFDGILMLPVLATAAVGMNFALIMQLAVLARVAPEQPLFVITKSTPLKVTVPITRLALPVFFTETACSGEELPTVIEPKDRAVVEAEATGFAGATPSPVRLVLAAPDVALEGMLRLPVNAPVVVGMNIAFKIQLARGARVVEEQASLFRL